jgi:flagellar motility protein MotE (MotC chaperone)
MKLNFRQIIILTIIAVLSVPLSYLCILFLTGNARIVFSERPAKREPKKELEIVESSSRKDSILASYSKTFQALQQQRKELEQQRERLGAREDRLKMLAEELERKQSEMAEQRKKYEKVVARRDELETKRIRQLAKVYGAMRAAEAAQILETLDDDLVIKILTGISDDRQKGKIVAQLSKTKAARISRKMGSSF